MMHFEIDLDNGLANFGDGKWDLYEDGDGTFYRLNNKYDPRIYRDWLINEEETEIKLTILEVTRVTI